MYVTPGDLSFITLDISTLLCGVKSKQKEEPVALFCARDKASKKELWRFTKSYTDLIKLDTILHPYLDIPDFPKVPSRALFQSHAPSRVDTRSAGLIDYFENLLAIEKLHPVAAQKLCEFMSTGTIDPMDAGNAASSRKSGYLTKRGKKVKGWKVSYFLIEGDCLNYYDAPGFALQGSIHLIGAKIGRQTKTESESAPTEASLEKEFRHAFLLVEPTKKDCRHVLCAESDEERDLWIEALLEVIAQPVAPAAATNEQAATAPMVPPPPRVPVNPPTETNTEKPPVAITPATSTSTSTATPSTNAAKPVDIPSAPVNIPPRNSTATPNSVGFSSVPSNTSTPTLIPEAAPSPTVIHHTIKPIHKLKNRHSMSFGSYTGLHETPRMKLPSEHSLNDLRIHDEDGDGHKEKRPKKKSFFSSFRNRSSHGASASVSIPPPPVSFQATPYSAVEQKAMPSSAHANVVNSNPTKNDVAALQALGVSLEEAIVSQTDPRTPIPNEGSPPKSFSPELSAKRVFGVPLFDAVHLSAKNVYHCKVPSIVYRCIELLKVRGAIFEEGIFRLSGSTSTIRTLKERFNTEYDVDLVNSETYYDIHAVAGLLKLYLREIPTLMLSPHLAPEFRTAVDIPDLKEKTQKLKTLTSQLPKENRDLLCVLCSLLKQIITNSEVNKMNLRNVGIVFAPTMSIQASVLINFLTDFDAIFGDAVPPPTPTTTTTMAQAQAQAEKQVEPEKQAEMSANPLEAHRKTSVPVPVPAPAATQPESPTQTALTETTAKSP